MDKYIVFDALKPWKYVYCGRRKTL